MTRQEREDFILDLLIDLRGGFIGANDVIKAIVDRWEADVNETSIAER